MAIHGGFSNGARATTGVETIKLYDLVYMDGRKRPISKPLFEGGTAHPEDYFDVVEHFSESTG